MRKMNIKEIVFGNSPTDLQVVAPFIAMGFVKMWGMSERVTMLEMGTRNGFYNIKKDVNLMKKKVDLIGDKLGVTI